MEQARGRTGLGVVLLVGAVGFALGAIVVAVAVGDARGVLPGWLARDMATTAGVHPLTGVLSNVGVLLWCSAGSVCLFAAGAARGASGRLRLLVGCSGVVGFMLCLDDFFLIHDDLAYRHLGVGERTVLGLLGLAMLVHLAALLRFGRRGVGVAGWVALGLALVFWGGSLVIDRLQERMVSPYRIIWEDGLKLLGIAAWWAFCHVFASRVMRGRGRAGGPGRRGGGP